MSHACPAAPASTATFRQPLVLSRLGQLALVALLVALAAALAGCTKPFCVHTNSKVFADLTPTPRAQPVVSMHVERQGPCGQTKIALIDVDGLLVNCELTGFSSMGENPVGVFHEKLEAVACDPCVRAVVLRINSHGGGVTACDIMRHELLRFKQRTCLPVIACLLDVGAGGAYYLATAADQIVAHPTTVTGGIGVILNLYNLQDTMAQFNVVGVPIKAGTHTDLGSPAGALSEEARAILQTMADEYHQRFCLAVEQARPAVNAQQRDDFDGRVFTAPQALERGLIDQVGYLDDAVAMARSAGGAGDARVVLFHRPKDRARSPYDATPNTPLQAGLLPISIPGLERSKLPTFLYVWQPEPTAERLQGK